MRQLFIATGNGHKVEEIRSVLGPKYRCHSLRDLAVRLDVAETGSTFVANACLKSVAWARHLADCREAREIEWVLADDSGLEVDALGGAPGVHSARFAALDTGAAGNSADADNNAKLLRLLSEVPAPRRTARFRCTLALTPIRSPQASETELLSSTQVFEGACEGTLLMEPSGEGGFGYDPLFIPAGYAATFSRLGEEVKNSLSHRGAALRRLAAWFAGHPV